MSSRRTYTVILPVIALTPGTRREVAAIQRVYFDTKRELLEFCARAAHDGRRVHIAVQSYVSLKKGMAGRGKLLSFATYTAKFGLVDHGLTTAREAQLRRYIPQAA